MTEIINQLSEEQFPNMDSSTTGLRAFCVETVLEVIFW